MPIDDRGDAYENLRNTILESVSLPDYVFSRLYENHLFFDVDIGSNDELLFILHEIIKCGFGLDGHVDIFSSSSRRLLRRIDAADNFIAQVLECGKELGDSGDCDGLILVDGLERWAAYQSRPIDVGVLAFESIDAIEKEVPTIGDAFFGCENISDWLSGKAARDVDLTNNFGRSFLTLLLENYCQSATRSERVNGHS